MTIGGSSPQYLGARPHGECGSANLRLMGDLRTAGSRGKAPVWPRDQGDSPSKAKAFQFLDV